MNISPLSRRHVGFDAAAPTAWRFLHDDPLIDEPFDLAALQAIPERTMANRFRRFLPSYVQYMDSLNKLSQKAENKKPRGWTNVLRVEHGAKRFLQQLEALLDVSLSDAPQGFDEKAIAEEMTLMRERREAATDLLVRGGINPAVFAVLLKQADNPAAAVAML